MKQSLFILIISMMAIYVHGQNDISEYIGIYGDLMDVNGNFNGTALELKKDGTFRLRTTDNVYPRSFKYFTNEGKWIVKDGEVILNPDLKKRKPTVNITDKQIGLKDSIEIRVNHYVELYETEKLVENKKSESELLTLYFNKRRKYKHLTREWLKEERCAWAPRLRNRVNLDSTNSFKIAKTTIKKIGVYTYGFTEFVEIKTKRKHSDYYEIDVVVPIDKERMPRNKKVIIKGNRAYFYESKGKPSMLLNGLWKKTS
jgi:hypothetical protein